MNVAENYQLLHLTRYKNPLTGIRLNLLKHVFTYTYFVFVDINPLNTELNPICL